MPFSQAFSIWIRRGSLPNKYTSLIAREIYLTSHFLRSRARSRHLYQVALCRCHLTRCAPCGSTLRKHPDLTVSLHCWWGLRGMRTLSGFYIREYRKHRVFAKRQTTPAISCCELQSRLSHTRICDNPPQACTEWYSPVPLICIKSRCITAQLKQDFIITLRFWYRR